ncbi:unnamed protein product [Parnassius mnemosyne]|uniref:Peptidase A2 domain-containing protein n=1 Tax=Parnassius mnemosyne TaxID=213953 RepID=A0AAV1KIW4_9NEOP
MLDEDTGKQVEERETTENSFFYLIAQAQSLLEFFENSNRVESSCNQTCNSYSNLKLPPLKIPPFDGAPNKWLSFRDTYLSLIHNNENIDDISKFHYLKSYLEGNVSSVINSVTVSSKNYATAWQLLCERYDNKRLLINEHIKGLFSIEPLHKETEAGIRNLIDTLSKNLSALNSLGEPTDKWDTIIIYIASTRLDSATARKWEEFRSNTISPNLEEFYSFLRQRAMVLETMNANRSCKNEKRYSATKTNSFVTSFTQSSFDKQCAICNQGHKLYECLKFKSLPVEERISKISLSKLCSNCFRGGHQAFQCKLSGCRICKKKHNTLLHKQHSSQIIRMQQLIPQQSKTTPQQNLQELTSTNNNNFTKTSDAILPNITVDSNVPSPSSLVSMSAVSTNQAVLSTALVKMTNNNKVFMLRALLDCGSQSSFISEGAQKKMGFYKIKESYKCVSGIGNTVLNITEHCSIRIHSLYNSFNISVKCYILPKITDCLPHATIRYQELGIPNNVQLADPKFYQPSDIDLLLGADTFWALIGTNRINLGPQRPILLETQLGWIVAGPMGEGYFNSNNSNIQCKFLNEIRKQLSKFWELEEVPNVTYNKDNYCETVFNTTTRREDDGRFCVQIPLKDSVEILGDSYNIAEKRFFQLEKKLNNNDKLKQEYQHFIKEYERLGHMTNVSKPLFGYYLPHHAVIRENSETTKLRVVFDASAKTSTGISLNDIQHIGPVVQDDLFSILLRYRQHKYVVTADVEKMYRQIMVDPNQRNLQIILWRDEPSQQIKIYQLNTVTYGMASAPFLSTRCLLQLSKECKDNKIAQLIKTDFYVDDFLSGAETESELQNIIKSVTTVFSTACFPLRKWRTNAHIHLQGESNTSLPKNLDLTSQSSVLGLKWDPTKDVLRFPVNIQLDQNITKRTILSNSAKLFDPLGLLSLCTIIPKIMLQKLWLTKLDWDDSVDNVLKAKWQSFINNLNTVSFIEIPRCVLINKPVVIDLHTFSDASQVAYASAVYLRSVDGSGNVLVRLLCAKTKVAPVKPTTIPRLELCGALLSARLSVKVLKAIRCKIDSVYHWTDSTIVLGWLSSQPCDLKPFVSNQCRCLEARPWR